ncbi:MAG TPA: murein L,D-transpeptidase catalytic domain family protein [Faecalibacter sp.]
MNKKRMLRLIIGCLFLLWSCQDNKMPDGQEQQSPLPLITEKAQEAYRFVQAQGMNTDFCILIDFSLHSGRKRLFVWDFQQNQVVESFLVSHGAGSHPWSGTASKESPSFSNEDGSHLSSLGKYAIGERGWSNWGIHVKYLLHGLEEQNSNALKRVIVLHSWERVSDNEVYPEGTPEGWGCPAVSNQAMETLDGYLKNVNQPVLLWIYTH